jgi:glycosyltransferase involved in cell wall biosynthesis
MNICISAYACDPTRGSEPGIGWNLVREVARRHHVWAVTRRKNERAITAELSRNPLPNLRMVFVDLPRPLLACKRGQLGTEVYYRLWHLFTRDVAQRLERTVGLHLTQHVTFGRYWGPTSLAHGQAPFVWGPVGGGETAPSAFRADFGPWGRAYELLRDVARRCGERDPSVRAAARRTALALAVTPETRSRLLSMGTRRVELFSAMGFGREEYERLRSIPTAASTSSIRFISIGRLLHWKGFHLGLKAFAAANVPHSDYWVVGEGPERARMGKLVRDLGLEHRVRFWGALPRPDTLETLAACHVLVHPSLHDSGGWVCLESMAAGKPVVCLDLGGPAEQVTGETGIKVAALHPDQAVRDLAEAMTRLGADAELRNAMGAAGRERVRREYLWESKGDTLDRLYTSVLANTGPATPDSARG